VITEFHKNDLITTVVTVYEHKLTWYVCRNNYNDFCAVLIRKTVYEKTTIYHADCGCGCHRKTLARTLFSTFFHIVTVDIKC